ncbi:MAG: hypothetical protein HGA33_02125 [Candidatus Moranbacteria bacterium]|nr:hypothetical protein [Candidatus Moranbacteria bacterium]
MKVFRFFLIALFVFVMFAAVFLSVSRDFVSESAFEDVDTSGFRIVSDQPPSQDKSATGRVSSDATSVPTS